MGTISMGENKVDTQLIKLYKQKETIDFIWYKFELEVCNINLFTLDNKGKKILNWKPKYGVFYFRKIGPLENESFEIIKNGTDSIFLENVSVNNRIRYAIYAIMTECYKKNIYPETIVWHRGIVRYQ